jgi:O-antigen ligase
MEISLTSVGITQADIRLLLLVSQAAFAVLTVGLFLNWLKSRHPGVLLSCGLFGAGAYFSYYNNNWWPLAVALGAGYFLKSIGFHMGYH